MPFQSSKITPKTLLCFPGRVSAAPSAAEPLLPVLIVLHRETSSPGRVGNALRWQTTSFKRHFTMHGHAHLPKPQQTDKTETES